MTEYADAHAAIVVREAVRSGSRVSARGGTERNLSEARGQLPTSLSGRVVFASDDFIIDAVQETDQERYSVAYTFSTPVVQTAAGGRQPRLYTYAGSLLSGAVGGSALDRWLAAWEDWVRATANLRGVERRAAPWVVEISYRDQFRRGYAVSTSIDRSADIPGRSSFSLTLFVIDEGSIAARAAAPVTTTIPVVATTPAAAPLLTEFRS